MSSILEALKKLEDEKAGRRSGGANIAAKVVKPGRRPGQRPKWLAPAGMSVAAASAALFTYILMGGFSAHVTTLQPVPPAPSLQQQYQQQQQLQQQQQQQQLHPQPAATPAAETAPLPVLPPVIVRSRAFPSSPPSPVTRSAPAVVVPPPPQIAPPNAEKPAAPSQPEAPPGPPALKISGIGWQKDNAERMAIINGKAVSEGAVVEGARVEEIFPDRVRFSFKDKTFEIPLGKIPGENASQ